MNQQPKTKPKRLLLDVTISATTQLNTGIQRVVRKISEQSEKVASDLEIEVVPVVCQGDQMSRVGFDGRSRWDFRICSGLYSTWMNIQFGIAKSLSLVNKHVGEKYLSILSRMRKLLVPKTLIRSIRTAYARLTGQAIDFKQDDVLVLLDASWDLQLDQLLKRAKSLDVPIATVVYDLIPVFHPQFHPEQLRNVFTRWLDTVVHDSDVMIGISKTVKEDLEAYIRGQGTTLRRVNEKQCHMDYFRLGADFAPSANGEKAETFKNQALEINGTTTLEPGTYYLSVGTIEPRKNHEFLLDAFDQIWENDIEAKLVIVGKVGWMCEAIKQRILNHPRLHKQLYFLDRVDDQQLSQIYSGARTLIFPSIVEGFGLPIVEAFQHGIPVLASDTPIHREVGGEQAIYFSLEESQSLAALVLQIESGSLALRKPSWEPITWEASCREFLSKIILGLQSGNRNKNIEVQRKAA